VFWGLNARIINYTDAAAFQTRAATGNSELIVKGLFFSSSIFVKI